VAPVVGQFSPVRAFTHNFFKKHSNISSRQHLDCPGGLFLQLIISSSNLCTLLALHISSVK
jgi:hypothetical protein